MATTTKKSPAKKPAPKKAVAKTTTKTRATKAKKQPELQSFRVSPDPQPFRSFRITRQTIYWIILVAFIIFVQLWILKLQIEVTILLDAQAAQLEEF